MHCSSQGDFSPHPQKKKSAFVSAWQLVTFKKTVKHWGKSIPKQLPV